MKRISIKHIIFAAALTAASNTLAQNLNTTYFMDGYAYGHELNPATDYDRKGYFSLPFLLGNMNFGVHGNLALKDLVYKNPYGGGLVSYLHPSISVSEAMDGFSNNNKLTSDMRFDILSFGFHKWGGYNNFTLGMRTNLGVNIPGDFFRMTKELSNQDYDFDNLGMTATSWVEMALGHSRQINEKWRVGAKAKLLLGIGYARLKMDNMHMDLSAPDRWTVSTNATMEMGVNGFSWGETETKQYNHQYPDHETYQAINLDNGDVDGGGLNGTGFAVDLGAEWDLGKQGWVDGLKVSASLLDLGFIKWKNVAVAQNRGEQFVFDGFNDICVKENGEPIEEQADAIGDRWSDLFSMQDGGSSSKTRMLGATLNIGAEYTPSFYKKLKVGLLSTTRIQGVYSWNEERLSATVSPVKWFEASVSGGVGTVGASFGWVMNFHPRGLNLFLGMDHMLGKLSKQYIPLRSNADFTMGINFPLGKVRE